MFGDVLYFSAQVEDKERKVAFIVICVTIFLSGFLYTYLIPLVPSYHLITGAYFSTAEVALLFASYSFGEFLQCWCIFDVSPE